MKSCLQDFKHAFWSSNPNLFGLALHPRAMVGIVAARLEKGYFMTRKTSYHFQLMKVVRRSLPEVPSLKGLLQDVLAE